MSTDFDADTPWATKSARIPRGPSRNPRGPSRIPTSTSTNLEGASRHFNRHDPAARGLVSGQPRVHRPCHARIAHRHPQAQKEQRSVHRSGPQNGRRPKTRQTRRFSESESTDVTANVNAHITVRCGVLEIEFSPVFGTARLMF